MLSVLILGGMILGLTMDVVTFTQRQYLDGWMLLPRLPVYGVGLACLISNRLGYYRPAAYGAIFGLSSHAVLLYFSSTHLEAGLASLAAIFLAGILVSAWEGLGILIIQIGFWMYVGKYPHADWIAHPPMAINPAENTMNIMGYGLFALMVQAFLLHYLKQTVAQLEMARKQSDAGSEAKSRFLSHISHELRTPAAGIIGMLQLTLKRDLQPETRHDLEIALNQGEAQLGIINDLLDIAKIEAGKYRIEILPFEVITVVEETILPLKQLAEAKGLKLKLDLNISRPFWILGDAQRLRQILVNLVGNAIKFTSNGLIRIQVLTEVDKANSSRWIRFEVSDTGIGIAAEFHHKLFKAFEQGLSKATQNYTGTGLGLAISHQLALALGGRIHFESEEEKGSVFILSLPYEIAEKPADPIMPSIPQSTEIIHRLKILLVDDVATNRYIACSVLENLGQNVECAENGKQACEILAEQRFDVVLMDMRMPIMNGTDASKIIREGGFPNSPILDSQVRIIALTANAGAEDKRICLAHGMNGYLVKPLRENELKMELATSIAFQLERGFTLPFIEPSQNSNWVAIQHDAPESNHASPATESDPTIPGLSKIQKMWPSEAPKRIEALRDALELGDLESLGREAHNVKGAARYLQLSQLAIMAEKLETAADTKADFSELNGLMNEVESLIQLSIRNIEVQI